MIHELKCWTEQFQAVVDGNKTAEWRKNDRDFMPGDVVCLREYMPCGNGAYTGRAIICKITWITTGFGIPEGWCVLSIQAGFQLSISPERKAQ